MAELTLEESVQQILPTLPLPIQKFFGQRRLGETARLLMERHALHVDQGAILERELMFLLLGLENPDQFAAELYANLPVSEQTVRDIMADINKEVFIPLRNEMMAAGNTPIPKTQPPIAPQPLVQPQPQPQRAVSPPSVPPPQPRPMPPSPISAAPKPPTPSMPKPQPQPVAPKSDLAAAIQKATQTPPPTVSTPPTPPRPTPAPVIEAVRSAPIASALSATSVSRRDTLLPPDAGPPPASNPPAHRPYPVDPYREPVEEDGR